MECFLRFCFIVKTSADKVISLIFDIFANELSLSSIQLTFLKQRNSIELKKGSIYWWKCQKLAKSRFRPTFSLRTKTSAIKVILQIFEIFPNEWSLFSIQLTLLRHRNSIGLKKDLILWWKCQKFAKSRCRSTFSQWNKTSGNIPLWNWKLSTNWTKFKLGHFVQFL